MFLINAVPFKCPLITQSLCKCDCNNHSRVYNCSIFKTHQAFFSLLCAMEYVNSHVQRNLYCLLKNIHVWKHNAGGWRLFPKLREHDTVVHLSTMRHQQQMSPGSPARSPFPVHCLACFTHCYFLLCFTPFFFFFFFFILPLLLSLVPSLPADVLCGFIWGRNECVTNEPQRTPKAVCGEARSQAISAREIICLYPETIGRNRL